MRAFGQRGPERVVAVAEPPPDAGGLEATTATQVVTMPAAEAANAVEVAVAAVADGSVADVGACVAANASESPAPCAEAGAGSSADGSQVPAAAATDVVPDLMATPVFAKLKMPDAAGSAGAPDDVPDQGGPKSGTKAGAPQPPSQHGNRLAGLLHSRRGLVITAPIAASALVAGIVSSPFPATATCSARTAGARLAPARCAPAPRNRVAWGPGTTAAQRQAAVAGPAATSLLVAF